MSRFLLLLFIYGYERAVKWEPLPALCATSPAGRLTYKTRFGLFVRLAKVDITRFSHILRHGCPIQSLPAGEVARSAGRGSHTDAPWPRAEREKATTCVVAKSLFAVNSSARSSGFSFRAINDRPHSKIKENPCFRKGLHLNSAFCILHSAFFPLLPFPLQRSGSPRLHTPA